MNEASTPAGLIFLWYVDGPPLKGINTSVQIFGQSSGYKRFAGKFAKRMPADIWGMVNEYLL